MPTGAPNGHQFRLTDGSFLGSFRIVRALGVDAEGEVYLAKSSRRLTRFLVRLFPESLGDNDTGYTDLKQRCSLASAVHHPGVARMSDLQEERGCHYVAYELPDGPRGEPIDLAAALAETEGGVLPEERVKRLIEQLCEALHFCHQFRQVGLPHGQLVLSRIYLTAQRQPRIADFSHLDPGSPQDDIQAIGRSVVELLTGKPIDSSRQSAPGGLNRHWKQIVDRALSAGTPEGYQSVAELKEDVSKRSAAHRPLLWAIVSVLLLTACALGIGVFLRVRAPEEAAAAESADHPTRQPGLSASQTVNSLRQKATQAVTDGDLGEAERAYEELLSLTPDDQETKTRLEDIRLKQALASVNVIKKRAEAQFADAREVRTTDGFKTLLESLVATRDKAADLMAAMEFDQAAAQYRHLENQAQHILQLDRDRTQAHQERLQMNSAVETAENADAQRDAVEVYAQANQHRERAERQWQNQQFTAAQQEFRNATGLFMKAATAAAIGREMVAARALFEEEKAKTDHALLERLPPALRSRIDTAEATALQAQQAGQLQEAREQWRRATKLLTTSLEQAATTAQEAAIEPATAWKRPASGNLVLNGEFEQGANGQPANWSPVDGLTTFWEKSGHPGHCIRFDTNVQQSDKKRHQTDPEAFAGKTPGNQYGTVGAHEGVWLFSPPIPVESSDQYFVLEADCLGPAKSTPLFYPQVLIRGYQLFDPEKHRGTESWFQTPHPGGPAFSEQFGNAQRRARLGDYLMVWRHAMPCRNRAAEIWEHYQMAIKLPDEARFRPDVILLKAYAMWPLGEYRFDNIVLRAVGKAEYEKVKAKGHSIEGFMPTE